MDGTARLLLDMCHGCLARPMLSGVADSRPVNPSAAAALPAALPFFDTVCPTHRCTRTGIKAKIFFVSRMQQLQIRPSRLAIQLEPPAILLRGARVAVQLESYHVKYIVTRSAHITDRSLQGPHRLHAELRPRRAGRVL